MNLLPQNYNNISGSWKAPTLKQQQFMGNVAGGVGAAQTLLGTVSQGSSEIAQARALPVQAPTQQTDVFGRPVYNLNDLATTAGSINPRGATGAQLGSAAIQGAAAGAAFGPIGAAVGAVVNTGVAALMGRKKKKIEERQKSLAMRNLLSAQSQFNQASNYFNTVGQGRQTYNQLQSDSDRYSNFFRY